MISALVMVIGFENSAEWQIPVGPLRFRRGIRIDGVELVDPVESARLKK